MCAGFNSSLYGSFLVRREALIEAAGQVKAPEMPASKEWRPKQPQLMRLDSYEGNFPKEVWPTWPEYKPTSWTPASWISGQGLKTEAEEVNYPLWGSLCWAVNQLEMGAYTGVVGAGRLPSAGANAKSAIENGHLVSDSLAEWIRLQLIAGPYDPEEIPWLEIKISPMGLQVKTSGHGRILVDMSFPWKKSGEKVNVQGSVPISPNDGISLEDFPTAMDGTPRVLRLLTRSGPGCFMTKADWSDAYKVVEWIDVIMSIVCLQHIHVREADLHLQIVSWGGKLFVDRSLTFGSKSSPGIYDSISNIVRDIANLRAGNERREGFKCLDDTGVIGTYEECKSFYSENREVCSRIGVRLAPDDDPEKAFDAATSGVILGLSYDTRKWLWTFSPSKITRLEIQLHTILDNDEVEASLLKSVAGKLNHYHRVISPRGRWERGYLVYKAADSEGSPGSLVDVRDGNTKRQVLFWLRNLQLSREGLPIPDPFPSFR